MEVLFSSPCWHFIECSYLLLSFCPDLYPSNVTLAVTFLDGRAEDEVVQLFGPLGTGDVACRKPRMARFIGVSVPEKLIYPGSLSNKFIDSGRVLDDNLDLRLVDFGQGKLSCLGASQRNASSYSHVLPVHSGLQR
jgi:hypothetical protein